jgi:hypothetical protein
MKYAFSRSVKFVPTWNENEKLPEKDQVSFMLKPLELEDLFLLMDATQSGDGSQAGNLQRVKGVVVNVGHLLPKYATMSGLTDPDGSDITIADLVVYPTFLNLASEVLMKLANISMPSEATSGN